MQLCGLSFAGVGLMSFLRWRGFEVSPLAMKVVALPLVFYAVFLFLWFFCMCVRAILMEKNLTTAKVLRKISVYFCAYLCKLVMCLEVV